MTTQNVANQPKIALDGELLIGSTGVDPVSTTLTAGANITITNGAGSITIDSTGGGGGGASSGSIYPLIVNQFSN